MQTFNKAENHSGNDVISKCSFDMLFMRSEIYSTFPAKKQYFVYFSGITIYNKMFITVSRVKMSFIKCFGDFNCINS